MQLNHLQKHLFARELHGKVVYSFRKYLGVEFDELEGSSEEGLETLHDFNLVLVRVNVVCVNLLDWHFNF